MAFIKNNRKKCGSLVFKMTSFKALIYKILSVALLLGLIFTTLNLQYNFVGRLKDLIDFKTNNTAKASTIDPNCPSGISIVCFYVATNTGNDTNPGSFDLPFKTIYKAKDFLTTFDKTNRNIYIFLRGGTYNVDKTLEFDLSDSAYENGSITYSSYPGETALLSGGYQVPQSSNTWSAFDSTKNIYRANVGQLPNYPKQLYINDEPAIRARTEYNPSWLNKAANDITFDNSQASLNTTDSKDSVDLVTNWRWRQNRCTTNDIVNSSLVFDALCYEQLYIFPENSFLDPGTVYPNYYLENAYNFLDAENEWYYNKTDGYLYYKPVGNTNPNTQSFVLPQTEKLINIAGYKTEKVKNITFENLQIKYGSWSGYVYGKNYFTGQSGVTIDGSSLQHAQIDIKYSQNIVFRNNLIKNMGSGGVKIEESSNNKVIGNTIQNIAGIGVTIGNLDRDYGKTSNTVVYNNLIQKIGYVYADSPGIFQIYASKSIITHNEVTDGQYTGISLGWGWTNMLTTQSGDSKVEYNKIHKVMQILRDGGVFYTLSVEPNLSFKNNYVYDSLNDFGFIYVDNGGTLGRIESNVIKQNSTSPQPWLFQRGADNRGFVIKNNFVSGELDRNVYYPYRYFNGSPYPYPAMPGGAENLRLMESKMGNKFVNNQNYTPGSTATLADQQAQSIIDRSGLCTTKNDNINQCDIPDTFCTNGAVNPPSCTNQLPTGSFEKVENNTIYGWAKDPNSNSPISVKVGIGHNSTATNWIINAGNFVCDKARTDSHSGFGCEITIPSLDSQNPEAASTPISLTENPKNYQVYLFAKDSDSSVDQTTYLTQNTTTTSKIVSSGNAGPFVCDSPAYYVDTTTGTTTTCEAKLLGEGPFVIDNPATSDVEYFYAGLRHTFGNANTYFANSSPCTVVSTSLVDNKIVCTNVVLFSGTIKPGVKEVIGHRPNIEWVASGGTITVLEKQAQAKQLPTAGLSNWGDRLSNFVSTVLNSDTNDTVNLGKLKGNGATGGSGISGTRTDLSLLTTSGKIGIGTDNPTSTLGIVGLQEYASESQVIAGGLKNGDLYKTGSNIQVVVNGSNPTELTASTDPDCYNSSSTSDQSVPTRLPVAGLGDSGVWGKILSKYLCVSQTNSLGKEGKLKTNLLSISTNGKLGIGTNPSNVVSTNSNFAIKSLASFSSSSQAIVNGYKNGDVYVNSGKLQIVTTGPNSDTNSQVGNCVDNQITSSRLPKANSDGLIWGKLLNNFLCTTRSDATDTYGRLKPDLARIVADGKIGIGTNNPTSVLSIQGLANYSSNADAVTAGLVAGDVYRRGNDLMVVV